MCPLMVAGWRTCLIRRASGGVYVQPFPAGGRVIPISTEQGNQPVWSRDGSELFYRSGNQMIVVEVETEPEFSVTGSRVLFEGIYETGPHSQFDAHYDVASDGRFLMLWRGETEAITLVQNWFRQDRRRRHGRGVSRPETPSSTGTWRSRCCPKRSRIDPDRLARFEREAKVLASLNHPNIGAIYGWKSPAAQKALVLELIEGPTLADRIKQGPIPVDEALPIAKQIAEALEAAHEQGIIHRDLKPAEGL